ncbi:MAG TPA: SDR family oxidoreductase [Puia sp.]|nr:SDR family oxidoreductase [Puia sp.]
MAKTVLITGASSGFGRETALLFQKNRWNVIASMRSPEKETELSKLGNVLLVRLDVTDKQSIAGAVKAGIEKFGKIDVLVNNAGFGAIGALEAAPDEAIRRQYAINLFGLIDVTKVVLPEMRKNRDGLIINISSMGGRITIPFGSLYNSTKFAIEGLTEALQYELNPLGIQLKIVEPGSYKTNFNGRSMDFFGAGDLSDYQPIFEKFTVIAKSPDRGNKNISEVSETIYQAATDGSEQLRYLVGADAIRMIQAKQEKGDVEFKKMIG